MDANEYRAVIAQMRVCALQWYNAENVEPLPWDSLVVPVAWPEAVDLARAAHDLLCLLRECREELRLIRSKDGAVYDPTLVPRLDAMIAKAAPAETPEGAKEK